MKKLLLPVFFLLFGARAVAQTCDCSCLYSKRGYHRAPKKADNQ